MKAFPAISKEPMDDGEGCWYTPSSEGMELRDYFAAKAMQGFLTEDCDVILDSLAHESYQVADAMMRAREK
jgi:hypothetical protein